MSNHLFGSSCVSRDISAASPEGVTSRPGRPSCLCVRLQGCQGAGIGEDSGSWWTQNGWKQSCYEDKPPALVKIVTSNCCKIPTPSVVLPTKLIS